MLSILLSLCLAQDSGATAPPNFVLILADDLGAHDTGFSGASFYETPHLDALAAQAMVFRRAYTCGPNCAPTRACLMTGMYTPRHHIYTPGGRSKGSIENMRLLVPTLKGPKVDFPPSVVELSPDMVSLAEVLKSRDYVTARLGKWHLGEDFQGFDLSSTNGEPGATKKFYGNINVAEKLTDAALAFLDEHRSRPFFLLLTHWDVHTPIRARRDVVKKYKEKKALVGGDGNPQYAGMIEAVDTSVGRVHAKLRELGLEDNTLLIFSSDNGGLPSVSTNRPLRAGKGSLFEGGIRVPTFAYWAGSVPPGTCDTPITSVDFLPTFAALSGAELPAAQPVDGVSIERLLVGDEIEERSIYWFFPLYLSGGANNRPLPILGTQRPFWRGVPAAAVVRGRWKLLWLFEDDSLQLYDVENDIGETTPLQGEHPEIAASLHDDLKQWLEETKAPIPTALNPAFGPGADEDEDG